MSQDQPEELSPTPGASKYLPMLPLNEQNTEVKLSGLTHIKTSTKVSLPRANAEEAIDGHFVPTSLYPSIVVVTLSKEN